MTYADDVASALTASGKKAKEVKDLTARFADVIQRGEAVGDATAEQTAEQIVNFEATADDRAAEEAASAERAEAGGYEEDQKRIADEQAKQAESE